MAMAVPCQKARIAIARSCNILHSDVLACLHSIGMWKQALRYNQKRSSDSLIPQKDIDVEPQDSRDEW